MTLSPQNALPNPRRRRLPPRVRRVNSLPHSSAAPPTPKSSPHPHVLQTRPTQLSPPPPLTHPDSLRRHLDLPHLRRHPLRLPVAGQQLHGLAIKDGQMVDAFVGCSAFDMYGKTGLGDDACKFRQSGGGGDAITFCAFLNACSDAEDLKLGRQLHGFVIRYGYEADVSVANGLVDFYGKCHEMGCFEVVFGGMSSHYDVSWSSMVAAYEQNDEQEKACFVSVHALAAKACLEKNVFVGSALVDMYGKCGSIEDCEIVFHEMALPHGRSVGEEKREKQLSERKAGEVKMGIEIFESMRGRYGIELGIEYYACVVDMLSRAGKVEEAYEFIRSMPVRPNVLVWGDFLGLVEFMENQNWGGLQLKTCLNLIHMTLANMYCFRACLQLLAVGRLSLVVKLLLKSTIHSRSSKTFGMGGTSWGLRVYGKPELGRVAAENLFELDPHDSGKHVLLSSMFAASGRWEEANLVRKEMKDVRTKKGVG
ncbi:hypothetical protein C3L33_14932, partial [Rhododendron williamsianum]